MRRGGVWACICVASQDPRQIPLHVGPRLGQWRERYCWQWLGLLPEILQVRTRGLLEGGGGKTSKEGQPWKKRGTQQHLHQQLKRLEYPVLPTTPLLSPPPPDRRPRSPPAAPPDFPACLMPKNCSPILSKYCRREFKILPHNDREQVAWRSCLGLPTY